MTSLETVAIENQDSERPQRSPEHQALIDKFKDLGQLAGAWAEQNPNADTTRTGITFHDLEAFLGENNPSSTPEETSVSAARLFNRIIMEEHHIPAPEDLSRLDTTSETASVGPAKVIEYAAAHLKDHLESRSYDELHDMIRSSTSRLCEANGSQSGSQFIEDRISQIEESIRNRHPASEYPTLPEY